MGKIIGESFDPYVDAQVKIRQKKLGSKYRSDDLLTKITSKNPWLRLTSGIEISEEKANEIGLNGFTNVARAYQLQGGPLRFITGIDSNRFTPRGGVISNYGDDPTQSYGYNSSTEYGLVPLPSLESFSVTPKNNGSLTQADITIKCYNKSQFQIIETLYLRLGFTLLLEWGHSVYTDNDGTLVTNPTNKLVSNHFLNPKTDDPLKEIQDLIAAERKDSCGNYDGLVGRVTNFDWSVTPDGHYTAKVKLTSTGDVIDSLKINNPLPSSPVKTGEGDDQEVPDYEENVESTPLGRMIRVFKDALDGNDDKITKIFGKPLEINVPGFFTDVRFYSSDVLSNSKIARAAELNTGAYNDQEGRANREIIRVNGRGAGDYFHYIKLGALLRIIQNFLLIYDTEHNNTPIIKIDWKYEDNICSIPIADVFSADPRITLIPSKFSKINKKGEQIDFESINSTIGTEYFRGGSAFTSAGVNFMHIYINMDFVMQTLTDNVGSENEILLINFLQSLCDGINQSLSNLVQLEPFHDLDTNILHIVNKTNSDALLASEGKNIDPTKFRVGLLPQGEREGSFVKDISIGSTIPPNFATQIAIGAQANDTEVSSNSAPFSTWNRGLKDRIITEKKTAAQIDKERKAALEAEAEAEKKRKEEEKEFEALEQATISAANLNNRYDFRDSLFNLESAIKEYFKIQSNVSIKGILGKNQAAPIIIPISLNLTIDGLSGIKIFQKYTITEDFLPDNYKDSIEFIVKGIGHNIDAGGWTTKIEGQCIPKLYRG